MNLKRLVLSLVVLFLLVGILTGRPQEDWRYFISGIDLELFETGMKQVDAGELADAAGTFSLLTERMPTRFSPYLWLAGVYSQLGDHKKTVDVCNKVRYRFSIILRRFGNPAYKNPIYSQFYYTLGMAYFNGERYREAAAAFERLLKARNYKSTNYSNLKKFYPTCGIAPDAFYALVHYHLGVAYSFLGEKEAAMVQYNALQKLDAKKAAELFKFIKTSRLPRGFNHSIALLNLVRVPA